MFRSLHTSSSVVHITSAASIHIIRGLLECYSVVENIFKNIYLTIFMVININIMNKQLRIFTLNIKNTFDI